jgi:hypothetical protein
MDAPARSGPVVVAVFDTQDDAAEALDGLREAGVTPRQVSLMLADRPAGEPEDADAGGDVAGGAAGGAAVGGLVGGLAGWLAGIGALAIPGIGPVIGAGVLASLLAGAALGAAAGGLLGGLVGLGIPEEAARGYESHLKAGRVLLTVHAADPGQAARVRDAVERAGAYDARIYGGSDSGPRLITPPPPATVDSAPPAPDPAASAPAAPAAQTVANFVEDVDPYAAPPYLAESATPAPVPKPSVIRRIAPLGPDRGAAPAAGEDVTGRAQDPAPPPDPNHVHVVGVRTATPYRGAGDAARNADPAQIRALDPTGEPADRGLDPAAEPAVDRGPFGADTEYRSGGAGSRGE